MYKIYALYNRKHNKIYIGQTQNIDVRLALHERKTFTRSFTTRYDGAWEIIYEEQANNRKESLKREKQLKSYQGRQFIKKHIPA